MQINYNDYHSNLYGRIPGIHYRYTVEGSLDGKVWNTLIDRSKSFKDVPNDYVELGSLQTARFIRYKNIHVPTPFLSISDLRVFGLGQSKVPQEVKDFSVKREEDSRNALVTWQPQKNCQGYNVLWGIEPDKLYSSWMVYDKVH